MARTIGVAVEVPDPDGSHLRAQRASFGDPAAHRIPPHITLLPPTEVAVECHDKVIEHLLAVTATTRSFTVRLRGTATFRPVSPVVFVPLVAGIAECERLEAAVRSGPLERDVAFNYHPHVTVAHHLADEALDAAMVALEGFDSAFEVTEILMYEYGADEVWRPQQSFHLSAAPPSSRTPSSDRTAVPVPEPGATPPVSTNG